jgi:hypothetical protein
MHFILVGFPEDSDNEVQHLVPHADDSPLDSLRELYGMVGMLLVIGEAEMENHSVKLMCNGLRYLQNQMADVFRRFPSCKKGEELIGWREDNCYGRYQRRL